MIDVRLATPEDIGGALASYARNGYTGGIAPADRVLVARHDGDVVGVVRLAPEEGVLLLRGMFIDEPYRGRGLGRKMLFALASAIDEDCWLTCPGGLAPFYGQIGFVAVDEEGAPPHLRARTAGYRARYGDQCILLRPGSSKAVTLRTDLRAEDVEWIVGQHGIVHHRECGFDETFEAYVRDPLSTFVRSASNRERLWVAERDGRPVGCVAIVEATPEMAQLRWFLVTPEARGGGLGKRLLDAAVTFCKDSGYRSVMLWTVDLLTAAAHLYGAAGFSKVEERPGRAWGVDAVEERYELTL